ncbi:MAG: TPM domain-containing protein [Erysipelotrichales bacterium]|nr:TPM domain-containing protein [Erysipelotrichales bacterium]
MRKYSYLLIVLLTFLFGMINVNAQVNVIDRNINNNYGVNKKWVIDDYNMSNVLSTDYVDASEKIYDFAGILSENEKSILKSKIDTFIKKNNMELVILTVNKQYYTDSYNEDVAADFYDYNDFGLDYPNYDGILIYRNINTYSNDPYYDIYTFGEAQLYFNQTRYDDILDSVYSEISSKDYLNGFSHFINLIDSYVGTGIPSSNKYQYIDDMGFIKNRFKPPFFFATILSSIVTFIIVKVMISKNNMVKEETKADIYLDLSTINYSVRNNVFNHSTTTSYTISSSTSGGGSSGGGHSSSGSSGGGHSSGGGRHG